MDVSAAVAFLQKTSSTAGGSVYDHLAAVVGKVLEEQPDSAVNLLETSVLLKKTSYNAPDPVAPAPEPVDAAKAKAKAELFVVPPPPINEETGEPEEVLPPNDYETENVLADMSMFSALGCGMGDTEAYEIMLAQKKLGEDPALKLATVRFFGKFFGMGGDYYVFESTLKEPEAPAEAEEGAVPSEVGTGTNAYTYFVCSALGGEYTKLPDVTPAAIVCARTIKKYLTGSLTEEVSAYPPFPGKEDMFLRAQIAQIAADTVLCPSGFFSLGEDGTTLEKVEEFAAPDGTDLSSWVHRYPYILKQGRCELFVPPPEGDEEPAPPEEEEGARPLLAALEAPDDATAWSVLSSSTVAGVKNKVMGVSSIAWPGAVAAMSGSMFSNMYVGWGVKNAPFVPLPPPPVLAEYEGEILESAELPPRLEKEAAEGEEAPAEE